jgi:hypothetical protein
MRACTRTIAALLFGSCVAMPAVSATWSEKQTIKGD